MGLFDFSRKSNRSKTTDVVNRSPVYDTIVREGNLSCCYCNNWGNAHSDVAKVLECYPEVKKEDMDEILDGVSFIINQIPNNFPIKAIRIALYNRYSVLFEESFNQDQLSQTSPVYGVTYFLYIGAKGIGWNVCTYDSWGESHSYDSSKRLYWEEMIEYSVNNVYKFLNATLNAMGYASISVPISKRNLKKLPYAETQLKSPEEEFEIGFQFYTGKGRNIDLEKACLHFKNSARQEYGKGMYYYAICLLEGKGTQKNIIKGRVWLEKACEKGVSLAYEQMGWALANMAAFGIDENASRESYRTAFLLFKDEAKKNDHEALYHLALCYHDGLGVEKDANKFMELLTQAMDNGSDEAYYYMALCYTLGDGVERDVSKSFECYQKAASLGNVEAYYNLGYCYESGTGTQKDLNKAFEWYMKGAQQQHAYSQYRVGICFMEGIGTERNMDKALVFLNIASNKGFKDASRLVRQIIGL